MADLGRLEKGIHGDWKVRVLGGAVIFILLASCNRSGSNLSKGALNLELGDYRRARSYFEAVVNKHPTSAPARLGLAKALLQQCTANPTDTMALIDCLTQLEAARTLQPVAEVEKLLGIVWFRRAKVLLGTADTLGSLQALSRSISLDPKSAGPVNLAGILYFHRGETTKASNLFRLVTTLDTASVSGYFNAGMVFWADSNYALAYENWFKAAKYSSGDKEIIMWAARAKERISGGAP